MEAICDAANIAAALRAVMRNRGAPGVDGITVRQLPGVFAARWREIKAQILSGRCRPQPVRRVPIPKPGGGTRILGIPTVIDRLIQQAVLQRLQPLWDGIRPSARTAMASARAAPPTRRWRRRRPTSPPAISTSWISTCRDSSTESPTIA